MVMMLHMGLVNWPVWGPKPFPLGNCKYGDLDRYMTYRTRNNIGNNGMKSNEYLIQDNETKESEQEVTNRWECWSGFW